MRAFRFLAVVIAAVAVSIGLIGCAPKSKFKTYDGPEVTSIQVQKANRKMYLLHDNKVLKAYDIALGFTPEGHKQFEGDGKTPEGAYYITHKKPNSSFHLSLGISYPNAADRAYASTKGRSPGGDIYIHGGPRGKTDKRDWTAGCIAVTDAEMEEIYAMIKVGTPIFILK